jgi:uncharacterized protein (DUF427 family)
MTDRKVIVPGPDHPITIEPTPGRVTVTLDGRVIADTRSALTLQEASYPPVQYIPLADVDPDVLAPSDHASYCPFKGEASYFGLRSGDRVADPAVWTYAVPHDAVAQIRDHVAFYPDRVDSVEVHPAATD